MKIVKLTADNFKKLSAVEITPDGNVVVISGKNAAGKSSVLDSIEAALCGGRSLPKQPIRTGEQSAKVELDLGEYKVTRRFLGTTSRLTVETTGETKSEIRSPQKFLDNIVGNISFDPLAFLKKTPTEQRTSIMEFLGLNLDGFDNRITLLKVQRSDVRKEKERKQHEADSITHTLGVPDAEVSSETLLAELKAVQDHNEACRTIGTKNALANQRIEGLRNDVRAGEKAILDWQHRLTSLLSQISNEERKIEQHPDVPRKNSAEVETQLKSLEETNKAVRLNTQKREASIEADKCAQKYTELGAAIKITENNKARKMAESVMPVKGLAIQTDGLSFDGIPLEQVNDAKKLEICVAVAIAMNPELKVLRINGNDFDPDNLIAIGKFISDKGYQVWIEKACGEEDKVGFYIEDGHLAVTRLQEITEYEN